MFFISVREIVRGLSIRLSNPNKHSNTNDPDKTEREKYHERKRDERMCVCAEACEGMLEDMLLTEILFLFLYKLTYASRPLDKSNDVVSVERAYLMNEKRVPIINIKRKRLSV